MEAPSPSKQTVTSVLHFEARDLTFEVFRDQCLRPNRPCIVHRLPEDVFPWRKLSKLLDPQTAELDQGEMGIRELIAILSGTPAALAPIHQCRVSNAAASGSSSSSDSKVAIEDVCQEQPLDDWLKHLDSRCALSFSSTTRGKGMESPACETWYLKDWHWQQTMESFRGNEPPLYSSPGFLGEDWLNDFIAWQQGQRKQQGCAGETAATALPAVCSDAKVFGSGDDYRFVYIGEADGKTFTPFHFDVFGSYSWSVNVKGFKQWYFVPWWDEEWMRIFKDFPPHRERPLDIRCPSPETAGHHYPTAAAGSIPFETVIQEPGDLVFVPSCYFHQVHNISLPLSGTEEIQGERSKICISVNHNWCNEWNIDLMLSLLSSDVERVKQLVDEEAVAALKRDGSWLETVEQILKSSGAWSMAAMDAMLEYQEQQKLQLGTDPGADVGSAAADTLEIIRTSRQRLQNLKHSVL